MFTLTADLTAVPPEKYITHENHPLHKILYLVQLPSRMPNASSFVFFTLLWLVYGR